VPRKEVCLGPRAEKNLRAVERRSDMYIGLGTVLLIILIVLLVAYVF
jgi:hypothetical protein